MAEVGRVRVCDPGALLPGGFWAAVAVWLEKPQVVNKRLSGARLEARGSAALPRAEVCRPRPSAGLEQERRGPSQGSAEGDPGPGFGPERSPTAGGPEQAQAPLLAGDPGPPFRTGRAVDLGSLWGRLSRSLADGSPEVLAFLSGPGARSPPEAPQQLDLALRTVIPKRSARCPLSAPGREVVVQDVPNGTITFLPLEENEDGHLEVKMNNVYQIQLSRSKEEWFISVLIFCPERWHSDGVIHPNPTWLGEELLARLAKWSVESKKSEFKSTLSLISILRYSQVYQELKEKYKEMVKVWPEVTDPEKFVYEDVAIAAYLLILWEEERAQRGVTTKQSFVDLGCGNGLLVHILCSEGHPGRGIDVRRRKIWDLYGPQTQLEVCLIGKSRTYPPSEEVWMDEQRTRYIRSRQGCPRSLPGGQPSPAAPQVAADREAHRALGAEAKGVSEACTAAHGAGTPAVELWLPGFHPREKAEPVRNCASLPRDFIDQVVLQVANLLLGGKKLHTGSSQEGVLKTWNGGESLSLMEVARELDRETLQRLKRECGGLQTLLRNSHQVFAGTHFCRRSAVGGLTWGRLECMPLEGCPSGPRIRLPRMGAQVSGGAGSKPCSALGVDQEPSFAPSGVPLSLMPTAGPEVSWLGLFFPDLQGRSIIQSSGP
ncbi:probable tRNA (uracil-O(2)-)-methyltransferase isoform X5 [Marmota marmota marmota]|uniref:probable tRNA (uracil-O(2)-)-methyltransferase isoform X5 n=1 Tax=Marmota marmota marmota TaxID=9994 RepID=UPI002093ED02|nr:probable tRNA (uracil-O(2)-)-methyltransferase isoform X5 [Marmota marmota marmota]